MKTLHWYLVRQVVATLVMTVGVFTGVLLLGSLIKEMLVLLINQNVNFLTVIKAIGMLIPFILVFALPIGLLTATLLVFSRLSADQELTAMRASGISLTSLITPLLLFSVLMSLVCALINLDFAPRARHAYREILNRVIHDNLGMVLPIGTFIDKIPGYTIYIGGSQGNELRDLSIYQLKDGKVVMAYTADRAVLVLDEEKEQAELTLYDGQQVDFNRQFESYFGELPLDPLPLSMSNPVLGDQSVANMSLMELLDKRRELLDAGIAPGPVNHQIHSKISFSFACIGFTLVGIPLGLQAHRRETKGGIFIALILISVYYGFFIFAESMVNRPQLHPWVFVWVPNFLFQAVGAVLIYRADHQVR